MSEKIINFHGGYIRVYPNSLPTYKDGLWKIKFIAKIIASDSKSKTIGEKILLKSEFTTNGFLKDEYYKYVSFSDYQ